ncbi:MAG: MBL fold metallo-hydrolase [Acetobacteraceae bacterium]|jgi:7,8-dihydropterin-6-yl-methyl-4-(beta-D-ribofuranosyl)aminobenzene 5'-phosphate synthase
MPTLTELDRLEVQVLVDNVTDSLSSTPPFVTREWPALVRAGMRRVAGGDLCCANHGLSLVIRAVAGAREHVVLFDAGPVDYAVERNGTRLGVDFGAIEAVVLSHGHWDHAGGLLKAFEMIRAAAPQRRTPIYLHPGMFAEGGTRQPDGGVLPAALVPSPDELRQAGALPEVTKAPQELLDGMFYLSGEIPRVTAYETGLQNHVRRNAQGDWQADPLIMDERFLAVAVKGKGVVVFTACSHAGVVNVLTHARECLPDQKLYAVMGGFHLSGETERCIPETVRDIAGFGLTVIAPGHCTGWRALNRLIETCREDTVAPLAVGKIFAF